LLFLTTLEMPKVAGAAPVVWGLHAGFGLARVSHNLAAEQSSRARLNVGASLTLAPHAGGPLSFQTGLSYVGKGGKSEFAVLSTDEGGNDFLLRMDTYVWSLKYLEVPFFVHLSGEIAGVRCFAKAGPEAGVLFAADVSYPDWRYADGARVERSISAGLRDVALSMTVAGGVALPIGKNMDLNLESSYARGLTDIDDSDLVTMKTRTVGFSIGVEITP
jgi:hypothetical protein